MTRTSCAACPLRRFEVFEAFSADDIAFTQSFKSGEMQVEPGTTLMLEGMPSPQLFTVLAGLGLRHKTLEDGQRQVINFVLPGDLIGLQAAIMGEMAHSVEATTDMTLCVFNRADLWRLFRTQPQRAFDLTWLSAVEEHFLGETLVALGRRSAQQRVAWALVRIHARLRAVGMDHNGAVPMPWRQRDLADALGLSLVHTNKTLGRLRDSGLARWSDGTLLIPDMAALARMAGIDLAAPPPRPLI
ncbi:Crp/Fnr family transcriptional regulator [Rhodobaculum claviforme]|uniref:Crp/Fnr family transcriptional regulator n=1 Tax=Rhodobaculum claviforme TaxID=1549854 RepID=A0A934TI88_9RHOB|nr:Crp/Fnr family transcriptional regulator [Rhodobaculum claviforme]MBK5926006.1 Crp/Fnr family transcriptional regulator [Rhodobaculum claviforme]